MSVCLITGDVNLDQLVKVVSVGFLYCKVTDFPFVITGICFKTIVLWFTDFDISGLLLPVTSGICQVLIHYCLLFLLH